MLNKKYMRKINGYMGLLIILLSISSCVQSEPEEAPEEKTVTIRMG